MIIRIGEKWMYRLSLLLLLLMGVFIVKVISLSEWVLTLVLILWGTNVLLLSIMILIQEYDNIKEKDLK